MRSPDYKLVLDKSGDVSDVSWQCFDTKISKLPDFNRADVSGNALRYCGIDRVLASFLILQEFLKIHAPPCL
jgi:hypothetical protein